MPTLSWKLTGSDRDVRENLIRREGKIHSNEGIKDLGGIIGIINPAVVGSDQF